MIDTVYINDELYIINECLKIGITTSDEPVWMFWLEGLNGEITTRIYSKNRSTDLIFS